MMNREYNISDATAKLAPFLEANQAGYQGFRRRAILVYSNNQWSLLVCTIEAITRDGHTTKPTAPKEYPQAILYEDWLSCEGLLDFVAQVNDGRIALGEHTLNAAEAQRLWSRDQVPLKSIYMERAGQVFSTRFDRSNANMYGVLLAPGQPYYPDITEAGRDWLPFKTYHGSSDARNGEVVLLLPETRAFLHEVTTEEEMLKIRVVGTHANDFPLVLNGAWWEGGGIHHFEIGITNGSGEVRIPTDAARVEFVLTDQTGTIYDYLREDNYRYQGIGRDRSPDENTSLVRIVRDACQNGEGLHVEFKPFIELDVKKNNEKLKEIIKTVVAYANTKGGRIFLGINDDCELVGIDDQLAKWVAGVADASACTKYLGALRGRIRDVVLGDPVIAFKQTVVDGRLVAIIEVSEVLEKPSSIRQDQYLYVRRGSNNMKAAPDQWKTVLGTQQVQFPV